MNRNYISKITQKSENRRLLSRMLGFLKPVRRTALIAGAVVAFRVAVEVVSVYFLSPAVTSIASHAGSPSTESFWAWIVGGSGSASHLRGILVWMAGAQLLLGLGVFLRSVWDVKLSMRTVHHIRAAVYDSLQRVQLSFFDRMSGGQVINRAIGDLQNVRSFINLSLLGTLDIIVSFVLYFALLSSSSPWLLVAALVPVPFWWRVISDFGKRARPICVEQQEASDQVMVSLTENIVGTQVVRAFAMESREIEKYRQRNDGLLRKAFQIARLNASLTPRLKLIGSLSHIALFLFCSWLIQEKKIQVGDLMLLGATMAVILAKLQLVNQIIEAYQKALVSSRRLFEILDLEPAVKTRPDLPPLAFRSGEIEFDDVTFSIDSKKILENVSARIRGGRVTALIGPTGSGKTILAGLIARFADPQTGSVKIDGQDLRSVDLRDLRHHVGYVFQETFLFSGSIRDNIRYGRQDVSEEMLRKAARVAHADEFIEKLPHGYDTVLGDAGVALSGGQRQRLALARALVYDPEILILDDATAALDATTERLIHDRLDPIFENRTVLIIAHRFSNLQSADDVLVMKEGSIIETGDPDELIRRESHYSNLYRLQWSNEVGKEECVQG